MTEEKRQVDKYDLQEKIHKYKDMLYKIAFVQLKNESDAEDVIQEVFCQYFKSGKEFETKEYEKAWFIKVTLNACRKVWRSAWYRHRAEMPELEVASESEGRLENAYVKREQQEEILKAVLSLPAKYRDVIHLFYYEELSINEICDATGRNQSTVTSQLTRGRQMLGKKLKEEYNFE